MHIGILVESVLEGMAEYYSVELGQKVVRGMNINAEKGLYNGCILPLGFIIDKNKRYQIEESKAQYVRKVFEMYYNGYVIKDLITYFNNNNIKTHFGNEYSPNAMSSLLRNEKYIGIYRYKDIVLYDAIPPIVDKEIFDKVQERLNSHKRSSTKSKTNVEYLLTTKLFCGHCKEMLVGISGTSKSKKTYNYYSCNGIRKKICNKKNVPKEYIEDLVIGEARKELTIKNINKIAKSIIDVLEREKKQDKSKQIEKEIKELEKQKGNLLYSLRICDFDSARKAIFEDLDKVEQKITKLNIILDEEKNTQLEVTEEQIKFFLYGIKNGDVNDIRYRRLLINIFVNKIYLYDDHLTIIFNTQSKDLTKNIPTIEEIECSFKDNTGSPLRTYTNTVYFIGGFAIRIDIKGQ